MGEIRNSVRFILNDDMVELTAVPPTRTVLDFLRLERRLRGTKEGCAEGDCGACTVLVGRLRDGELRYEAINACIAFVGMLDGAHVVSIEHLSGAPGGLHPVQESMVAHHGSQCGFCTPGFVMSLYGLWLRESAPTPPAAEVALQGNLCRCTGYRPIISAAEHIGDYGGVGDDPLVRGSAEMADRLRALDDGARVEVGEGPGRLIVPRNVDDLAVAYADNPGATLVAGATDVGLLVTKFMRQIGPIIFVGRLADFRRIDETVETVTFGGGVSYTDAWPVMAQMHASLGELWHRLAGAQIRNAGTIGGNIANGSPIGDTPPPFIALGATVTLRQGDERRIIPLEKFFIAYGKQDRAPGEFVESVTVPRPAAGGYFSVYKVSKRREEDITAVCGAFNVALDRGVVTSARIAFGGMAATPKRASAVEAALIGQPWTQANIEAAVAAFGEDYQPLTDMRASAQYRLLVAQNLLRRFYLETTGTGERLTRRGAA